jgi:glycosyltransferase involved in cell wall biosynthesis
MIELMRGLGSAGIEWVTWAGVHSNKMLHDVSKENWMEGRLSARPGRHKGRIKGMTQERAFSRWLNASGAPIVHRTYYPIIDLAGSKVRRVETLHDMWDERSNRGDDKGARMRSWIKRRALERADLVICVSHHSREELLTLWPWLEPKTKVIPHGIRRLSVDPIPAGIDRPFFLFVGRRGLYKNFGLALESLRRSGLADHDLVCFGGGPLGREERTEIQSAGLSERVVQIEGGDDRLAGLYEAATALLYPSTYEGFGFPLLEAMVHDCPVVAAPLTSLPEVGGDAVLYAPPSDADAWAAAILQLVMDADLANRLRSLGRQRATQFLWSDVAAAHADCYRSLR